MEAKWFNVYGLIFVAVILIPNVIFAMKCKDGFVNKWNNKLVETVEQIGRFACFILMIFQIPGTFFGWYSQQAAYNRYVGSLTSSCVHIRYGQR